VASAGVRGAPNQGATSSSTQPDRPDMGSFLSTQMTPSLPASTPSLCVLPLRTNGQARFSVASGPVPSPLTTRLADTEWQVLVESINAELLPLSHFGFMSLLLPFLLVDLLTMMLLCAIDPWLLLMPWDYGFAELLLPISLELALVFCGFPLMVHIVNRRMAAVQSRVRALLDTASRQLGSRGVNFQLKQAILGNGAGTNLWVEVQVMPLTQVFVPVPIPLPDPPPRCDSGWAGWAGRHADRHAGRHAGRRTGPRGRGRGWRGRDRLGGRGGDPGADGCCCGGGGCHRHDGAATARVPAGAAGESDAAPVPQADPAARPAAGPALARTCDGWRAATGFRDGSACGPECRRGRIARWQLVAPVGAVIRSKDLERTQRAPWKEAAARRDTRTPALG
jgi:hypothetical protein